MADIFHDFVIHASAAAVFETLSSPEGLDKWWTKSSSGKAAPGHQYQLHFGSGYDWRAIVSKFELNAAFELTMTQSDPDWEGTKIGFQLQKAHARSQPVLFYHKGWRSINRQYQVSNFCWAMYLRLAKRWLEKQEEYAFELRLSV